MSPQRIQVPAHMVEQLLGGAKPANTPPDVVEVRNSMGSRIILNADAIESVQELLEENECILCLKGVGVTRVQVGMSYDAFLKAMKIEPRRLYES